MVNQKMKSDIYNYNYFVFLFLILTKNLKCLVFHISILDYDQKYEMEKRQKILCST